MSGAPCGNLVTRGRKERPDQLSERRIENEEGRTGVGSRRCAASSGRCRRVQSGRLGCRPEVATRRDSLSEEKCSAVRINTDRTNLEMDVKDGLDRFEHHVVRRFLQIRDIDGESLPFQPDHDRIIKFDLFSLLLVPPRLFGRWRQHVFAGLDTRGGYRGRRRLRVEKIDKVLRFDGGRGDDDPQFRTNASDPDKDNCSIRRSNEGSTADSLFEHAEEQVGVATSLVGLVDHDDRVPGYSGSRVECQYAML